MRYGWRARIGHIAPAILDTSVEEFRKLLPDGVLHVGLTISEPIQTLGAEQAAAAFERMVDAGRRLAREKVDALVCGGAPVALSKGPKGDAELADLLRRETGLPVVMANGAVVEALRLFGARSVVAVSPFVDERNQDIKRFLEASGFRVPAARGLGLIKNIDFAMQSAEAAYDLARAAASAAREADAVKESIERIRAALANCGYHRGVGVRHRKISCLGRRRHGLGRFAGREHQGMRAGLRQTDGKPAHV